MVVQGWRDVGSRVSWSSLGIGWVGTAVRTKGGEVGTTKVGAPESDGDHPQGSGDEEGVGERSRGVGGDVDDGMGTGRSGLLGLHRDRSLGSLSRLPHHRGRTRRLTNTPSGSAASESGSLHRDASAGLSPHDAGLRGGLRSDDGDATLADLSARSHFESADA